MLSLLKKYRRGVVLSLFGVVALATVLIERSGDDEAAAQGGSVLFGAVGRSQNMVHAGIGGIGDWWDRYVRVVGVQQENERLRAQVERLTEERTRLLGVMQENAQLRSLVGFAEEHPSFELVPARVVARNVSPFFRVLSLRLRTDDRRVQAGMPVVVHAGVVGQVTNVASGYAEVMLTVDPRSAVDVLVQRNRARGVLHGLGHDDDYDARISYLLQRDAVRPGDVVVTSGLGGRFPADLVVGRVASIDTASFGLFQEVRVEPSVDFSRVDIVWIIVGDRAP